jgi:hypothetical protein
LADVSFGALIHHSMTPLVFLSVEKSPVILIGFPLYVMLFSFFVFNVLNIMCLHEVLFESCSFITQSQSPTTSQNLLEPDLSSALLKKVILRQ